MLEVEAVKCSSDVRMVVDAHHHPTLAVAHELRHALVLLEREVDAVAGGLPVRRIHVEERMRTIVALGTGEPRKILDVGTCERCHAADRFSSMRNRFMAGPVVAVPNVCPVTLPPNACCCR